MYRKIKGSYKFEDKKVVKKNIVLVTIEDISEYDVEITQREYDLSQFNDIAVAFHNKVLDDFDSEYDDLLADVIYTIVDSIEKEITKEDVE